MKKKRLIPFSWMPGAWGLKGKTRQRAEVEYYYSPGYEYDVKMAEIEYTDRQLEKVLFDIDIKYNMLTDKEIAQRRIDFLEKDSKERKIAELEFQHDFNSMSDIEYEKQLATINDEPWVKILNADVDKESPANGALELDWNEKFVEMLESKGFACKTSEDTVNLWLSTLCKNIALEEFAGIGTIEDDLDQGYNIKRKKINKDKWEAK